MMLFYKKNIILLFHEFKEFIDLRSVKKDSDEINRFLSFFFKFSFILMDFLNKKIDWKMIFFRV